MEEVLTSRRKQTRPLPIAIIHTILLIPLGYFGDIIGLAKESCASSNQKCNGFFASF